MRSRIACLLLAGTSTHAAAQPAPAAPIALQLRWELKADVFDGARGASRAAFTLTNRDTKPLPARRLGDLLQRAPRSRARYRELRLPHRGGDGHSSAARARPRLRGHSARPAPRGRVPDVARHEPQLRSRRALHRVRRRTGNGPRAQRLRRRGVRTLPAGSGSRPARGDAGGAVRARLGDPRHPARRVAARLPVAASRPRAGKASCTSPRCPRSRPLPT